MTVLDLERLAPLEHKELCCAILSYTRLYRAIQGLYTAIQGFHELFWLYKAKHGCAGIYWAILANTRLYMVILGHAVFWAVLGYTRFYLATLGYTYTYGYTGVYMAMNA